MLVAIGMTPSNDLRIGVHSFLFSLNANSPETVRATGSLGRRSADQHIELWNLVCGFSTLGDCANHLRHVPPLRTARCRWWMPLLAARKPLLRLLESISSNLRNSVSQSLEGGPSKPRRKPPTPANISPT